MSDFDGKHHTCYVCKHRGHIKGTVHSSCNHPALDSMKTPEGELFSIFRSVGRATPGYEADYTKLGIEYDDWGKMNGWFEWPYNFDPVWLKNCEGYQHNTRLVADKILEK